MSIPADDGGHLAQNPGLPPVDGLIGRVFRQKPDFSPLPLQALHRGLVPQQGHHDLAVVGGGLLVHHHQVVRQDAGIQHRFAPDPQGEILPVPAAGVEGQVILDALLGQNGGPGGHIAHNGHLVLLGRLRQGQGTALSGLLADDIIYMPLSYECTFAFFLNKPI